MRWMGSLERSPREVPRPLVGTSSNGVVEFTATFTSIHFTVPQATIPAVLLVAQRVLLRSARSPRTLCLELLGQPVSIHPVAFSTRVSSVD